MVTKINALADLNADAKMLKRSILAVKWGLPWQECPSAQPSYVFSIDMLKKPYTLANSSTYRRLLPSAVFFTPN